MCGRADLLGMLDDECLCAVAHEAFRRPLESRLSLRLSRLGRCGLRLPLIRPCPRARDIVAFRSHWPLSKLRLGSGLGSVPAPLLAKIGVIVFGSGFLDHRCRHIPGDRRHAELASALFDLRLGAPPLESCRYGTDGFFGVLRPLHRHVVIGQIGLNLALRLWPLPRKYVLSTCLKRFPSAPHTGHLTGVSPLPI